MLFVLKKPTGIFREFSKIFREFPKVLRKLPGEIIVHG